MAYLIKNIQGLSPDEYPYYFFDANAWIAALKHSGNVVLDRHEQQYLIFFESIITLHTFKGTKHEKKAKHYPKFIITSLLLSEIVNAYMRNVAMKVYYKSQGEDFKKYNFKKDYRITDSYKKQLKKLISDFTAFSDYIELRDDRFTEIDPYSILPYLNAESDFNDFYYYYSLQGTGVAIVTHDGDFIFQDIPIITSNTNLLKLA